MTRKRILCTVAIAAVCLSALTNCNDQPKQGKESPAIKPPKMSAKERLEKNNNLEKHLSLKENDLKGKVKELTQITYTVNSAGGKVRKALDNKIKFWFNTHGYITQSISNEKDGEEFKVLTMYDAHDNDTSTYNYLNGQLINRLVYSYDARNNEVEEQGYDADSQLKKARTAFKYDNFDNLIQISHYNNEGKLYSIVEYTFDENGFKTGAVSYDMAGAPTGKFTCRYDANGNYLYGLFIDSAHGGYNCDSCKYDGHGNRTEYASYKKDGSLAYKLVFKYDSNNNMTERVLMHGDGKIDPDKSEYYDYTYDATGNVLTKTTCLQRDGQRTAIQVVENEYVYY